MDNLQMMEVDDVQCDGDDDDNSPSVRLCCFIHSLQLCVRDGLKKASNMTKVLNKCHILIRFSHKSGKAADLLDKINKSLINMIVTRWNSDT